MVAHYVSDPDSFYLSVILNMWLLVPAPGTVSTPKPADDENGKHQTSLSKKDMTQKLFVSLPCTPYWPYPTAWEDGKMSSLF